MAQCLAFVPELRPAAPVTQSDTGVAGTELLQQTGYGHTFRIYSPRKKRTCTERPEPVEHDRRKAIFKNYIWNSLSFME